MAEVQTCRGAVLQFLRDRGIDVSGALKGASPLYRARQTATLLFGNDVVHTFATLGELGDVPENTPRSSKRHRDPSWDAFLGEVAQLASDARRPRSDFVVVAHGSFLGAHLTELTGTKMKFDNLDAHVLRFRFRSSPSPQLRFLSALHDPEADHLRVAKECRDRASEMAIAMRADDKNRVAAGDCPENFMVRTAR
jgi:broad specificity phosphatase PhoE